MNQTALLLDCHKIINWLQQRRKIPKDWFNYEKAAQQKIKLLLKDQQQYAECSVPELLPYIKENTQYFHYCDVVKVVEMLLRSKWAENKSLVFGYADTRVKEWTKLKKFMEDKQVGIINVAKFISQGLSFDLPSLDKSVELLDNQMTNLKRKIDFNSNTIYQQEKQSFNERAKMGFNNSDGQNLSVAAQIPRLIRQVPSLFQKVEQKVKQIQRYYHAYNDYCAKSGIKDQVKLAMVQKIIQKGNCCVNQNGQEIQEVNQQKKYFEFEHWKPFNEWGIQIENESAPKQDRQQSYQTILQKRSTKLELIEDLNQLLYFYYGLKHQQRSNSNSTVVESQNATNLVESQMNEAIQLIEQMINLINGEITTRIQLKNNAKAYQIVLRKFRNYEQNIDHIKKQTRQYETQIEQMKIKREETVQELRKFRARLVRSKNQCEKYLTELIKRQIRITGEINKLE